MKQLPNDPDKLREMLRKLKDREMLLEADLAIKECPELEQSITELVLCVADCRSVEKTSRVMRRTDEAARGRVDALRRQVEYHENKLGALRRVLAGLEDAGGKRSDEELRGLCDRLRERHDAVSGEFVQRNVDLGAMIPQLHHFLGNGFSKQG